MSYAEAIQKAMEGCKIRLSTWPGSKYLIYIEHDGGPCLAFTTGKARRFVPLLDEKVSTDWIAQCKGSNKWVKSYATV
jgi:hypothetical protein